MSRKLLHPFLICSALLFSRPLFTQVIHRFDIYYKVNGTEITWDAEHAIDSVFKKLTGPHSLYYVSITGYADSTGTPDANFQLSQARAKNAALYFEKYSFQPEKIRWRGLGNKDNNNSSLATKDNNRKVHIEISLRLTPVTFFRDSLAAFERFSVSGEFGGLFSTSSGTVIFVPSGAFVDSTGKRVEGKVTVLYREFRDTLDFISRGVSLSADHPLQFFDSDGMFEVRAYAGKTPVNLASSAQLLVLFGINRRMPLLDLYSCTSPDSEWQFRKHLTDNNGVVSTNRFWNGCGTRSYYYYDACDSINELVSFGLLYATSTTSLTAEMRKTDSTQQLVLLPIQQKLDSITFCIRSINDLIAADSARLKKAEAPGYKI